MEKPSFFQFVSVVQYFQAQYSLCSLQLAKLQFTEEEIKDRKINDLLNAKKLPAKVNVKTELPAFSWSYPFNW